jgi:hypothetical protein
MKIFLGDISAKVGREDVYKPTTGNESLHEISNDNGGSVVNFGTSKNLIVKSMMLPHRNIQVYLMSDRSEQQIVVLTTVWWWQKLGRDWQ